MRKMMLWMLLLTAGCASINTDFIEVGANGNWIAVSGEHLLMMTDEGVKKRPREGLKAIRFVQNLTYAIYETGIWELSQPIAEWRMRFICKGDEIGLEGRFRIVRNGSIITLYTNSAVTGNWDIGDKLAKTGLWMNSIIVLLKQNGGLEALHLAKLRRIGLLIGVKDFAMPKGIPFVYAIDKSNRLISVNLLTSQMTVLETLPFETVRIRSDALGKDLLIVGRGQIAIYGVPNRRLEIGASDALDASMDDGGKYVYLLKGDGVDMMDRESKKVLMHYGW